MAVYASLSQVQRIKRRLLESGRYVDMIRTPTCLAVSGCSFALTFEREVLSEVERVSRELGIEIRGKFGEPWDDVPG